MPEGRHNPRSAAPYVLENGEGDRLLTGDQLHRILATQENTNGEYIFVASDGPKGDPIVEHFHNHHTETFFCVQGQMTMWANGEEVEPFFRALGEPHEAFTFPTEPGPLRMDRVMAIIDELDLNVVAKSPLDRK